ncbi:MAG: sugar ABC transporter ATP-binding protein [Mesorhizobium sp.]
MRPSAERPAAAAPPSHPILKATAVSKRFGGVLALDAVDFELRPGEIHALMGENGAGKSTLMKILSGVYTDYDGELTIDGRPVRFASVRDAEGAGIAIIHQELNLVPELSVADNIFLGRERLIAGLIVDRKASAAAARGLLKRLGIELDPEARVGALRVGEQQLVEIAKALSIEARILIMDEPTSALSPAECQRLFAIIRQLAADGVAVVYISHRIEEVTALADRVTVFRDGRHVMTRPMPELDEDRIIAAMVGRSLLDVPREAGRPGGQPVLSVSGLTLDLPDRSGWRRVLHEVSFDLSAGEILGIGGLLGSGRTETLETIFGSAEGRRGGEIRLDGEAVDIRSPREARRLGLALVTEDRKTQGLHLRASIVDNVALPLVGRLARFGVRSFAGEAALARHAVEALGVRCGSIEQPAGTLSGGNQQKVVIGKWLATRPRVLLLDEPTRGIDVGAKREIYDLVFKLARDGLAIVAVSSEMPELLLLADRILVLSEGRQTGMLSRAEASEERIMQLAAPRRRHAGRQAA